MTNQQSEVLSTALLRNLAKKWWIVLIFALIGGSFSLKSRKNIPQRQRVQATLLASVNHELFNFLAEQANDVQITVTYAGNATMKVAAEADSDVENKLKKWVEESNFKLFDMVGADVELLKEQEKLIQKRKDIACKNFEKSTNDQITKCIMMEGELIYAKQEMMKKDFSMKILDIKPFILPPTSLPVRDIIFGMVIGAFIGLMLVSLYVQLKLVKNQK